VYSNQDKLNSSRVKGKDTQHINIRVQEKKSLSPRFDATKKTPTPVKAAYQNLAAKVRSTLTLKPG